MSKYRILLVALLCGTALCGAHDVRAATASEHPNVVIILADDQGWGDLSLNGNTNLSTPNIDSLAAQGVQFEHFYVSTVCAPTRASMLTGRYYERTGVTGVSTGQERINADETTMGRIFKEAGYATGAFGKWHNGTQYPLHPNAQGFDEFYGFTSGHWGNYFSPMLDHNGEFVTGEGYIVDDLTNKAMDFIGQQVQAGRPFLAYLPYCTPHSPMQVPDAYWDRFKDKQLEMHHRDPEKEQPNHVRAALAMCENIDWNVGRVLSQLDTLGVADNTIVIYFSDNGPNGYRWNGDMLGKKGSLDEGGLRVPFIIRWPGHLASGTRVSRVAGAMDILPTLTDLTGIARREPNPLDGVSLKPLLTDASAPWPSRTIFSSYGQGVSARSDRYRFSRDGKLFDMASDPASGAMFQTSILTFVSSSARPSPAGKNPSGPMVHGRLIGPLWSDIREAKTHSCRLAMRSPKAGLCDLRSTQTAPTLPTGPVRPIASRGTWTLPRKELTRWNSITPVTSRI